MSTSIKGLVLGLVTHLTIAFPATAENIIDSNLVVSIQQMDGDIILSWIGSNNVPYRVESGFNFDWSNASPVLTGQGSAMFFTNPIGPIERAFYRVKSIPDITAVYTAATGVLMIVGNELDNVIVVGRDESGVILVNGGSITVTGGIATVGNTLLIEVHGRAGNDQITVDNSAGVLPPIHLFGEEDADILLGSNGADLISGGPGDDFIDGNQGADTLLGGDDNDTFQWDPGDGNDVLEGQAGADTLLFNGSNASEIIDLFANGSRFQLFRNVASIIQDADGIEQVTINTLGGTDVINVNNLAATDVTLVNIDLAALGGATGDAQADGVIINGTPAADTFTFTAFAGVVSATGLSAAIQIGHPEVALDTLTVNGLEGTDVFNIGAGVTSLIGLVTNQ